MSNSVNISEVSLGILQKMSLRSFVLFHSEIFHRKTTVKDFWRIGLIERYGYDRWGNRKYRLSFIAKMYLHRSRTETLRFWIPVIISVVALLAAYDICYIKWLAELLSAAVSAAKTTAENLGIVHR